MKARAKCRWIVGLVVWVATSVMAAPPGGPPERTTRTDCIARFFAVMAADRAPTIAEFELLFGPHSEYELTLQHRYEGVKNPLTETPSDEVVGRVNKRLLAPDKHPSFFLCLLRREVPEVRSSQWRIEGRVKRKDMGDEIFTVRAGTTLLSFSFPIGDDYIGRLLDDNGTTISAERFLLLCHAGKCCQ